MELLLHQFEVVSPAQELLILGEALPQPKLVLPHCLLHSAVAFLVLVLERAVFVLLLVDVALGRVLQLVPDGLKLVLYAGDFVVEDGGAEGVEAFIGA